MNKTIDNKLENLFDSCSNQKTLSELLSEDDDIVEVTCKPVSRDEVISQFGKATVEGWEKNIKAGKTIKTVIPTLKISKIISRGLKFYWLIFKKIFNKTKDAINKMASVIKAL